MVVKPPLIFTELGALERDTFYRPKKAVYGFRRSPRLWGDHRDSVMEEMKVELEDRWQVPGVEGAGVGAELVEDTTRRRRSSRRTGTSWIDHDLRRRHVLRWRGEDSPGDDPRNEEVLEDLRT